MNNFLSNTKGLCVVIENNTKGKTRIVYDGIVIDGISKFQANAVVGSLPTSRLDLSPGHFGAKDPLKSLEKCVAISFFMGSTTLYIDGERVDILGVNIEAIPRKPCELSITVDSKKAKEFLIDKVKFPISVEVKQ